MFFCVCVFVNQVSWNAPGTSIVLWEDYSPFYWSLPFQKFVWSGIGVLGTPSIGQFKQTSSPPHSTTTGFPYNEGAFVWGPFCHMFIVVFFQVSLNVPWKGLRRPKLRMTIYIKKLFSKNCPVLPSLNPWPEKYHRKEMCSLFPWNFEVRLLVFSVYSPGKSSQPRCWFQLFCMFTCIWARLNPIWLAHIFQMAGEVQPPTRRNIFQQVTIRNLGSQGPWRKDNFQRVRWTRIQSVHGNFGGGVLEPLESWGKLSRWWIGSLELQLLPVN